MYGDIVFFYFRLILLLSPILDSVVDPLFCFRYGSVMFCKYELLKIKKYMLLYYWKID